MSPPPPPTALRTLLAQTLQGEASHVEKLTVAAAVISALLRDRGMEATLVGGAAIEFHAPGVYATSDLDFIVEGRSRAELDLALTEFGFARKGRHWVLGELFVEVPGNWMSDPVDVIDVAGLQLRVLRREIVLADRIIGFKHWRSTAYGAQAVALLHIFGGSIDETLLRDRLRSENAEDALMALRALAKGQQAVGEAELEAILDSLHHRSGERG
jgi:hypothetical protein